MTMSILEENLKKADLSFTFHCLICTKTYEVAVLTKTLSDGNDQRYFLTSNATRHLTQHGIESKCFQPKPKINNKKLNGKSSKKRGSKITKTKIESGDTTDESDANDNTPLSKFRKFKKKQLKLLSHLAEPVAILCKF